MGSMQHLLQPSENRLAAFSLFVDAIIVGGSLWIIAWLYELPWSPDSTKAGVWGVGLFVFFSHFFDLYHSWRGASIRREFFRLWQTWAAVSLALLFFAFSSKTSQDYPRRLFLTWFLMTPLVLTVWRGWLQIILSSLRRRGINIRNVAIVGARELGANLAHTILDAPWMGLRPIGFYDDRKPTGSRPLVSDPLEVVGSLDALVRHARTGKVDIVYITLPFRAEKRIQELISKLSDTTVSVYLAPDFFMFDLLHASWSNIGDLPVVSIFETPFYGVDGWVKRIEDILLGSLILLVVALPMIAIALAIRFTSPGPIIFKQYRYGLRGDKIEVWKFRSMTVQENDNAVTQATKNDARVTPLGAILRRTSLDELPQFINVIQGRMSIVGPRPHAVAHNEEYRGLVNRYMLRHKVKPGITGLAQISGWRGETDSLDKMEKRVEFDLAYIQNWSLWLDIKIIFLTIFRGFTDKNAY